MNNVIKVDFKQPIKLAGSERVELKNLWEQLDLRMRFSDWARQVTTRLEAGRDFGLFHRPMNYTGWARPPLNYWVSINAAKGIAMQTSNYAGDRVRKYFLECEKLIQESTFAAQMPTAPSVVSADFLRQLATELEGKNREISQLTSDIGAARIGPEQLRKLEGALITKAFEVASVLKWHHPGPVIGITKRLVKARFTPATLGGSFKDISLSDYEAAMAFVDKLTPDLIRVGSKFPGKTTEQVQDLKRTLLAMNL